MDRSGLLWLLLGAGVLYLFIRANVPSPGDPGYVLWYVRTYGELPRADGVASYTPTAEILREFTGS